MSVVRCILSDLPPTTEETGECMEITMDDAVTQFIKGKYGDSMMTTGWVVVASTAEGAIKGEQLRERLGLPKPPEPPPF